MLKNVWTSRRSGIGEFVPLLTLFQGVFNKFGKADGENYRGERNQASRLIEPVSVLQETTLCLPSPSWNRTDSLHWWQKEVQAWIEGIWTETLWVIGCQQAMGSRSRTLDGTEFTWDGELRMFWTSRMKFYLFWSRTYNYRGIPKLFTNRCKGIREFTPKEVFDRLIGTVRERGALGRWMTVLPYTWNSNQCSTPDSVAHIEGNWY